MSKKTNTRQCILQAARDLFSKEGYTAVSMANIAKEVDISKASLYYFFQNKSDIYCTIISDILDESATCFHVNEGEGPQKNLQLAIENMLHTGFKYGSIISRMDPKAQSGQKRSMHKKLKKKLHAFLADIITFLKKVDVPQPELAAHVLMSAIGSYIGWAQKEKIDVSPKAYAEYLSRLFLPH